MSSKHRNTDYSSDSLIGTEADVSERPDEQAAVTRLLSACAGTDAAEFALMLGVA